jgi:hypothetical protein
VNGANLPGFTADASLYKPTSCYRAGPAASGAKEAGDVHAAAATSRLREGGNGTSGNWICFGVCVLICTFVGRDLFSCLRDCDFECNGGTIAIL